MERLKLDSSAQPSFGATSQEESGSKDFQVALKSGCKIREYQQELAEPGLQGKNYIFVAPTGSGKTLVAAMVIASHLNEHKNQSPCHVAFVVPTRPLASEQMLKLKQYIPKASVSIYIGREFSGSADFTNIECPNIGEYWNHISVFTAGKLYDKINNDRVKFNQFSMLVLDECHHTVKKHAYAKLMKLYLHEKLSENQQPSPLNLQILGLTASLGAGGSSDIAGHLKDLAAHLDATGGIVSVKNPSDVEKYSKNKSRKLEVLQPRDITSDPFYLEINGVMSEIEKDVNIFKGSKYPRWSQQYETHVNQVKMSLMTASEKNEFFKQIASLSELKLYCNALMVYMDLRSSDAIKIIVESLGISENQTCHEISLNKMKDTLLSKLNELSDTENENSLLQGMESVLCRKFIEKVSSHGIICDRTWPLRALLQNRVIGIQG